MPRLHPETTTQTAGHVVFAAALPNLEVASRMDAAFTGIEPQHDFAQAQKIPAALIFGFNIKTHLFAAQTQGGPVA